jgi:hypothetical protein
MILLEGVHFKMLNLYLFLMGYKYGSKIIYLTSSLLPFDSYFDVGLLYGWS